jgi:hypothetical protein
MGFDPPGIIDQGESMPEIVVSILAKAQQENQNSARRVCQFKTTFSSGQPDLLSSLA